VVSTRIIIIMYIVIVAFKCNAMMMSKGVFVQIIQEIVGGCVSPFKKMI